MSTPSDHQDSHRLADQIAYDPNNLLDSLIEKLHLKNDAALSRALEVAPPVISKIRHRRLPVGASLLIRMHEVSNLSIRDLRVLMGDRREKFRISDKQFKPKRATHEKCRSLGGADEDRTRRTTSQPRLASAFLLRPSKR